MNSKTKKRYTSQKGITLIALVITIIVLLILAGVTINMVLGDEGIIAQAQKAGETYLDAEKDDEYANERLGDIISTYDQSQVLDSKYYTNDASDGFLIKDEYKGAGANANQLPTTIVIPNGVTKIGAQRPPYGMPIGAFAQSKVIKVVIPGSVTMIDLYAFYDCENLTSIDIPQGVTSIGDAVFDSCINLTNVKLADSITTLGQGVFYGCVNLKNIVLSKSLTSISNGAFCDCTSLTEIEIPTSVTSIGNSAFAGCTSLKNIKIPTSVTSIGDEAFKDCSSLTEIEIPESVTTITENAFNGCTNATFIVGDENVKDILENTCGISESRIIVDASIN